MRRIILSIAVCTLAASALPAQADPFSATLSGFEEIGALNNATGAILTDGEGSLRLNLDERNQTLDYTLTYSDLTSNVTQAHLHFGKIHVAGGVFVFLCSNLGNGPAGTPACPAAGGTVSGTITAAGVLSVPGQNISAGDFDEAHLGRALRALREVDGFRFRILGLVCLGKIGRDIKH